MMTRLLMTVLGLVLLVGCPDAELPTSISQLQPAWVDVTPDLCVARPLSAGSAELDLALEVLDDLGVASLRGDIRWDWVEPTQGAFDYSLYDPLVGALTDLGIEQFATLAYGNPWASSAPGADAFYPPDDPSDFAAYAGNTASHFAGLIQRYEIWSEPNAGYRFWKPDFDGDPAAYSSLLYLAAGAVHAADTDAEVWIGGTFFHDQFITGSVDFLSALSPVIWDDVDGLAFHPYAFYPPKVPPEYGGPSDNSVEDEEVPLIEKIARLRAVAADAGRPDLPLAATEFGWPSWGDVDLQEQADWAERAILLGLSQGVGTWCGYTLFNREGGNAEDRYGMADPDGTLTLYGARMQALAGRLEGVHQVGLLDLPDGQHGVAVKGPGDTERWLFWGVGTVTLADGTTVLLGPTPTGW